MRTRSISKWSARDAVSRVWCSVGEHPDSAEGSPDWVRDFIDHPKVVAIGETGLDYFREEGRSNRAAQIASFDSQLQLANETRLPIVVHTRSAEKDTIDLIKNHPSVTGVLHCFTESWEMAKVALDLGFYISISGIVTFKNADQVKEVAKRVPDDRLLIETDAPCWRLSREKTERASICSSHSYILPL